MITFMKRLASAVPTPAAGKVTSFVDSTSGFPSFKDEAGVVTNLESAGNKVTAFSSPTNTQYPSALLVSNQLALKLNTSQASAVGLSMLGAADAAAQTALLNNFTSALKGLVPASGGGTTNFLRADGAWAAPAGSVAWGAITGTLSSQTDLSTALGLRAVAANAALTGTITLDGDVKLLRTAANALALQNGVNPQAFQFYNTFTDVSNYERGFFSWASNTLQFGTEALGTGVARNIELKIGSTVVAAFGTPVNGMYARYITTENFWSIYDSAANAKSGGAGRQVYIDGVFGVSMTNGLFYGISPAGDPYNTCDVRLYRDAAGVWGVRNGTNAQTINLYNTFTDSSNYERGYFKWASNVLDVGVEAAGTGTVRTMRLNRLKGTTGAGSAAIGSNCPATTVTAPYTWVEVTTSDGSTAYIPAWK